MAKIARRSKDYPDLDQLRSRIAAVSLAEAICKSALNFDPFRRPSVTPDQPGVLMQIQNVAGCRVGSMFKADWGSNGTPIHSWKRYINPMNKIDTVYASRVPLYPPRVTPPPKPLNLPQSFIKFLSNPLLAIPESVYHEPLVVLRGPPAIAWVTDPALVKIVLLDRCDDFPQDPLLRRVLGPLFGNGILTSEGRDWRWQHQTVAPLFRHGEILRYVPAMVAVAESAIKAWSAAPPGPR